jgi:plasmid stabilization system protein ParE
MAKISYSHQALSDLERSADFLMETDADAALESLEPIDDAITISARHPLMGSLAESGMRELIISQGRTGYVALYSHEARHDAILALSIRHQREAGYAARSP